MMSLNLTLIRRIPRDRSSQPSPQPFLILPLTAEERIRSRHRFDALNGTVLFLRLPRGTVLQEGDYLEAETGEIIQIQAKKEEVITVKAASNYALLQAAYHLGNRHVALEITVDYLRFLPDSVLEQMLTQLDVTLTREIAPFCPTSGAYHHSH